MDPLSLACRTTGQTRHPYRVVSCPVRSSRPPMRRTHKRTNVRNVRNVRRELGFRILEIWRKGVANLFAKTDG
jgi:hypothetical protein